MFRFSHFSSNEQNIIKLKRRLDRELKHKKIGFFSASSYQTYHLNGLQLNFYGSMRIDTVSYNVKCLLIKYNNTNHSWLIHFMYVYVSNATATQLYVRRNEIGILIKINDKFSGSDIFFLFCFLKS